MWSFRDPNVPVKEKKKDDEEIDKEEIDIKGKGKGKGIFCSVAIEYGTDRIPSVISAHLL